MNPSRIFICADHGLAVIYFLQSDVLPTLLAAGAEVTVLTDDALVEGIRSRFGQPGVTVEGIRLKQANAYAAQKLPEMQWWLHFLRRVGSSGRINTEAQDAYVSQVAAEEGWKRRAIMPLARAFIGLLRRSRAARQWVVNAQQRFIPDLYADLFEKYQPSLVVASTYGWRQDRYLLREAHARGIPTAAAIVGWDNPSSYGLPATPVDWVTCWSEIQKQELTLGDDFPAERVHVGGIPSYDGYFRKAWQMPREEYFRLHGLDPQRKLIAYAASFVSFAPNYRNVEALARLVAEDALAAPAQLLIRLHPNHFWENPLFAGEREKIRQLVRELPHVHLVEPVPLVADNPLSYYSGEDMPEKSSMMAHADVFTTVYSTMVVEAAVHGAPIVSVCLDTPGGWNTYRKFSLPLSEIGNWPTHSRFREAQAGRVALNEPDLRQALNAYLQNPAADLDARRAFLQREITFTDGNAGKRTGEFLKGLLA
jgi:CDP-glycerol glycerophosphotransferase (TagB/SpsB family)